MKAMSVLKLGELEGRTDVLIERSVPPFGGAEEKLNSELVSLGLSANEARVYVHLTYRGPLKAREVSESLRIHRTEIYNLLTGLQNKGLVKATFQHPIRFMAVAFATALNVLIETKRQRLMLIEQKKDHLFNLWNSLPQERQPAEETESFQILGGVNPIYLKAREMLTRTTRQLHISAAEGDIMRMYQFGLIDKLRTLTRKNVVCGLLTERTSNTAAVLRNLNRIRLHYVMPDAGYLPHFILSDGEELLFLVRACEVPRREASALWTNYPAFVRTMQTFFPAVANSPTCPPAEVQARKAIQNA